MKHNRFVKGWIVLALLSMLFAAAGASTAWAATPAQENQPNTDRLSRMFAREQTELNRLGEHLDKTRQVVSRTEETIARLQEKGVDTAPLEAALSAFQEGVAAAQEAYAQADAILAAHEGFDENGQVTDVEAAKTTVKEAGQALQAARKALSTAARQFRQAVQDFRQMLREQRQQDVAEKGYARMNQALDAFGARLDRAQNGIAKAEDLVARLQERGVDTTPLETALADFQDGLAEAQTSYDQAASILATHAGFDEDGQVTDLPQARQTLKEAGSALKQAQKTLAQAVRDFRQAVREFRWGLRANRPESRQPTPQP